MNVTVNGTSETIAAACTIAELIDRKGLKRESLVVEYNQQIVKQDRWEGIVLRDGDTIELLNFVGGG